MDSSKNVLRFVWIDFFFRNMFWKLLQRYSQKFRKEFFRTILHGLLYSLDTLSQNSRNLFVVLSKSPSRYSFGNFSKDSSRISLRIVSKTLPRIYSYFFMNCFRNFSRDSFRNSTGESSRSFTNFRKSLIGSEVVKYWSRKLPKKSSGGFWEIFRKFLRIPWAISPIILPQNPTEILSWILS